MYAKKKLKGKAAANEEKKESAKIHTEDTLPRTLGDYVNIFIIRIF
jgi:hypothetical protein